MNDETTDKECWRCPWCGTFTKTTERRSVLCISRQCHCGALVLAAPRRDFDEILDTAVEILEIEVPQEALVDTRIMMHYFQSAGVDIVVDEKSNLFPVGHDDLYLCVWFCRRETV